MTITWFLERMAQWRDQPAIVWQDHPYTYGDLLDRVQRWSAELKQHAISPGQVVALEGDYSPNACALMLALIDLQTVVVPLTRAVRVHREDFLQIAEVQATIDFDENDEWVFNRREAEVTNPLTRSLIERNTPGLVVFSSGSTGKNKAVLHDFDALLEKFRVVRHRRCTLTFLLLDHLGGINTLLYTLSNGGSVVSVQSRDPEVICKAIADHKVQTLPTSPTFLNLLLISEVYKTYDLSSLELVTYGTEAMPESTLARLHEVFPKIDLLQTYGLSEIGVMRSKSKSSDSLWVKVGGEGFQTKVIDGILWIKARSAMLGYLNAPSPFDEEGWMNTQDMVEVDGDYIRILGRVTEIINVGGQKVYPAEVESTLLQMDNVRDVAVFGEKNPITGQIVVARVNLVEPEEPAELKKRLRTFCKDKLAAFKIPLKIVITENDQHSARYKKMRRG
jgi:long-chain acyl-CoA synthetase